MPVLLISRPRFEDDRGWFSETYHRAKFIEAGVPDDFCQDNHSLSRPAGTIRGLHFQAPPHAQAKLVRCVRGSIWDVAVDIRKGSPTFGEWRAAELSAANGDQLYVPTGFAHGFVTLEPDTEVQYKVSAPYRADLDRAIRFDDPAIAIAWPVDSADLILSAKDSAAPLLADADTGF